MSLANMTQAETDRKNRETCKRIAEELEYLANGEMYRCPECGQLVKLEFDDDGRTECPNCGTEIQEDEAESAGMYDYFDDVFDIEYRINGSGEYRSVSLMIGCGGPNIYVDTGTGSVNLYWWSDRASYDLSREALAQIDEMAEDCYNCTR